LEQRCFARFSAGAFSFRHRFGKSQKFSQTDGQAFALQWDAALLA
jgi:hypothetical protein